eukprot:7510207-Alexandrium_andersonii.AAC.1
MRVCASVCPSPPSPSAVACRGVWRAAQSAPGLSGLEAAERFASSCGCEMPAPTRRPRLFVVAGWLAQRRARANTSAGIFPRS